MALQAPIINMASLGSRAAGRRPTVLQQIALFVVVAAVIMNSSVWVEAAGHDAAVVGTDPNHPAFPSPPGKPYTGGRGCRTIYGCPDVPPAGGQP
ncbi:protein WIR1A-like [Triticum dicoccoides]|uniref:protein WIR1A-like n=1 Tax=Triticum dicoccoides TaxID=85692 RepID=UPI00188F216A|nr:protein WIR1A-like [Triticum dicoccoides]